VFLSAGYALNLEETIGNILEVECLKNRSVLVTGATGLIGSALVDTLIWWNKERNKNLTIYAAGRSEDKFRDRFSAFMDSKFLKFVQYDATSDVTFDFRVDYIIHAAGNAHPMAYTSDPVGTMLSNLIGTNNLLNYAVRHSVSKVLYISSSEVYGQKPDNQSYKEDDYGFVDLLNPRACYPSSKRAAETLCVSYFKQYGLDVLIARPGHIYGPTMTETDSRASAQFARDAIEGRPIVMKSPGTQLRSYCYVFDCVSALLSVLLTGESGEAYNIGNSSSIVTIRELAESFAHHGNVEVVFEKPDHIEASGYNLMSNSALDTTKLYALGWRGHYHLDEGVSRTVRLLKYRRKEFK